MKSISMKMLVVIILLSACIKKNDPCANESLPPVPTTPQFLLVDKNTGKVLFDSVFSLDKYISAAQPCHSSKLSVMNEPLKITADSAYHNFFSFGNVRFYVGYDAGACHTVYMTINGNDIDTLEFTGKVSTTQNLCNTMYNFEVEKIIYNGVEALPTIIGSAAYNKYYILRK
jgi:hypothetical protein